MELEYRESNRLEAKVARAFHKNIVLKKYTGCTSGSTSGPGTASTSASTSAPTPINLQLAIPISYTAAT